MKHLSAIAVLVGLSGIVGGCTPYYGPSYAQSPRYAYSSSGPYYPSGYTYYPSGYSYRSSPPHASSDPWYYYRNYKGIHPGPE